MSEPHKRYLVFVYDEFEAWGGVQDVKGTFDTMKEVAEYIPQVMVYDTITIYDRIKGEIINVLDLLRLLDSFGC